MVALDHTVDEANLRQGDDLLPPGEYTVEVVDATTQDTANRKGTMIVLSYKVVEGAQAGSFLTDRFNYWHESQKAQQIARAQFDRAITAMGLTVVKDTSELVGKRLGIRNENKEETWVTSEGEKREDVKNDIKKYLKLEAAPAAEQPKAAAGGNPWD